MAPHFLVVEDNPAQIALVIRALDDFGCGIEPVNYHDGAEALESLCPAAARGREHLPRFALLDTTFKVFVALRFGETVKYTFLASLRAKTTNSVQNAIGAVHTREPAKNRTVS